MAVITIDVPNGADLTRAVDAFCNAFAYQPTVTNGSGQQIPNPESKNVFAKRQIALWIKSIVIEYEASRDAGTARAAAVASASTLNIT